MVSPGNRAFFLAWIRFRLQKTKNNIWAGCIDGHGGKTFVSILQPLIDRTNAKLRYAKVLLDEIKSIEIFGGDDFDRAHQEAFLFHLAGAGEAFLAELNFYYQANLPSNSITLGKLRKAISGIGATSHEVAELYQSETDTDHWLYSVKHMRHISAHMAGVPRHYHLGGPNHQNVFLTKPYSNEFIEVHFVVVFENWLVQMEDMIIRMRLTAQSYAGL